jgi:hypothetical protein
MPCDIEIVEYLYYIALSLLPPDIYKINNINQI